MSLREQFLGYWISLWRDIPAYIWVVMLCVLILGLIVFLLWKGRERGFRLSLSLLLSEYVFLLYSSTVIFRTTSDKFSGYDYHPFWSYRAILSGESPQLLAEIIMNVVVFVPVGLLIGTQLAQKTQKGWLVAILVGSGLSVGIETLQFVYKKGFAEVDDVIHNTLGCVIGYGACKMVCSILLKFRG